ncbi:MAG: cytochrome P450 [Pseudomonadota bacterium]
MVRIKIPIMGTCWATTTAQATTDMLKDNERFTMRKSVGAGTRGVAGMQWWMPKSLKLLGNNMLSSDEPDHRRLRKLVDQAFQRRSIGELAPDIERIANDLLDRVDRHTRFDLVDAYARKLPLAVISELLGLKDDEAERFGNWASSITRVEGVLDFVRIFRPIRKMRSLIAEKVEDERDRACAGGESSGLIGELVRAEQDGERFSQDELIAMIFLLLVAGHETTTHLISGGVWALLQHPDQLGRLKSDLSKTDLAVEEMLRFVSPVQMSKPRYVQSDGDYHGEPLKKGEMIVALLAAANSDPDLFDLPEQFDISRHPNRHLGFGTGIHFCLGFQLARLEAKIALQTLLNRFPDLAFAGEPVWRKRIGMRALKSLPLRG